MMDHVKGLGDRAPVDMKLYDDPKQEKMIWKVREGGLGSTAWIPRTARHLAGMGRLRGAGGSGAAISP